QQADMVVPEGAHFRLRGQVPRRGQPHGHRGDQDMRRSRSIGSGPPSPGEIAEDRDVQEPPSQEHGRERGRSPAARKSTLIYRASNFRNNVASNVIFNVAFNVKSGDDSWRFTQSAGLREGAAKPRLPPISRFYWPPRDATFCSLTPTIRKPPATSRYG